MRNLSGFLCAVAALLAVLSILPASLPFLACEFSSACVAHSFARVMDLQTMTGKVALASILAPLLAFPAYTLAFFHHIRTSRDVLDDAMSAQKLEVIR